MGAIRQITLRDPEIHDDGRPCLFVAGACNLCGATEIDWPALLANANLEQVSTALIREGGLRIVMRLRECSREDATRLMNGEKL
jgi:hypothetical protein